MSVFRVAITAVSLAATVARHPAVRAGLKAAPLLITPRMREMAADAALEAAYNAGALARKLVKRQ